MKKKTFLTVVILALFLASCSYNTSLVKTSYDALAVSSSMYDTAMKTISDLNKRNLIPPPKLSQIMDVASTYSEAHNLAVESLADYQETKSTTDRKRLETQLSNASKSLSKLLSLIKPYLED